MYLLLLSATQRDYLIQLLKGQSALQAEELVDGLRNADDAFGIAWWTDEDIVSCLKQHDLPTTPDMIAAVRATYTCRHLADLMVEHGWDQLEDAVLQLQTAQTP